MKVKRILWYLLVFILVITSQASAITGGVVYCKNGNVIYQSIKDGKERNLTPDLRENISGPATISEDGNLLVWFNKKERKFFGRTLPKGKVFALPTEEDVKEENGWGICEIPSRLPYGTEVTELSISPKKNWLAYITEKDSSLNIVPLTAEFQRGHWAIEACPLHVGKDPTRPSTNAVPDRSLLAWEKDKEILASFRERGGRLDDIYLYDAVIRKNKRGALVAPVPGFIQQLIPAPQKYRNIIEIDKDRIGAQWSGKPGISRITGGLYKFTYSVDISVRKRDCGGLAWKPDRTLTYLRDGKIYSINGDVFRGIPKINGDNLHWITDNSFLFRGYDGALYGWENNRSKKLLNSVPEKFSYCSRSLFTSEVIQGRDKVPRATEFYIGSIKTEWLISGFDSYKKELHNWEIRIVTKGIKRQSKIAFAHSDITDLENIRNPLSYQYYFSTDSYEKDQIRASRKEHELGLPLDLSIDPRAWEDWEQLSQEEQESFLRDYKRRKSELKKAKRNLPTVAHNRVLLFRIGDQVAAIKPVRIILNEKQPWQKTKIYADKEGEKVIGTRWWPNIEYLIYEWKYWNNPPQENEELLPRKKERSVPDQIRKSPLSSRRTFTAFLEKPFYIGRIRISWNLCNQNSVYIRPAENSQLEFALTKRKKRVEEGKIYSMEELKRIKEGKSFEEMIEEKKLEEIENPSRYRFRRLPPSGVKVSLGEIIILRRSNEFAAIRPLKLVGEKKKSFKCYNDAGEYIKTKQDTVWAGLVYRARYW